MGVKIGFLLIALAGCLNADPLPQNGFVDNELFYHTDPTARIVGGSPAPEGSVPYMVALSQGALVRNFVCGGSILSQRTVLTAAHCIDAVYNWGALTSTLRVTVGTNRWNFGGQTYSVARNVTHQNYVSQTIKNDIGILVTSSNIIFSELVVPAVKQTHIKAHAVIPSYNFVGADVTARAAGFGRIVQGGVLAASLLELRVTTIDGERCVPEVAAAAIEHGFWNVPAVEPHIELCTVHSAGHGMCNQILKETGLRERCVPKVAAAAIEHGFWNVPAVEPHIELCTVHSAGHGMCNGDSGSALIRVDNSQQIGIVSWGLPCARGAPDMFVRVSAYRDWILEHLV
ncbi:trypsin domain-containing protein [Phthorimaea operculella]|nr:trypsin domain-containing protein [Phthorimaea operculella]